eukprot:3718893-Amphidinium_carterae.1
MQICLISAVDENFDGCRQLTVLLVAMPNHPEVLKFARGEALDGGLQAILQGARLMLTWLSACTAKCCKLFTFVTYRKSQEGC